MQVAASLTPHRVRTSFANVQVVTTRAVTASELRVTTDTVNLGWYLPKKALGGARITERIVDGVSRQSWYQQIRQNRDERELAQAIDDAIDASNLIAHLQPAVPGSTGAPRAGFTRIYVDKRSQYLEFETAAVPPHAQAVLDAIKSYRHYAGYDD